MSMKFHRILGRGIVLAILLAGLAGCSQYDVYGTVDGGIGVHHYFTK